MSGQMQSAPLDEGQMSSLSKYARAVPQPLPVNPASAPVPAPAATAQRGATDASGRDKAIMEAAARALQIQVRMEEAGLLESKAAREPVPYAPVQIEEIYTAPLSADPSALYESGHPVMRGDVLSDPQASVSTVVEVVGSQVKISTPAMGEITVGPDYIARCGLIRRG